MAIRLNIIARLRELFSFGPEVIVDFVFEDGLLYISIKNIGKRPAYRVSTKFDRPVVGVGGEKRVSESALFECIEFLPPGKEITTFLDTSASYFERDEPTAVSTHITYENRFERKYHHTIKHELSIYRDIGYVKVQVSNAE